MLNNGKVFDAPLVLSSTDGLMWISAYDKKANVFHVLGPVFTVGFSKKNIEKSLLIYNLPMDVRIEISNTLEAIPAFAEIILQQYAIMLHYSITGNKLKSEDIIYQHFLKNKKDTYEYYENKKEINRQKQWRTEQEVLRMVREGNLNYRNSLVVDNSISSMFRVNIGDSVRETKDICIIFTSLCVRAAIEGGLAPSIAYHLGDHYIQLTEDCGLPTDLVVSTINMYEDFILRVNRHCANTAYYSKPIQSCCDYIDMHKEDKLSLDRIASFIGYSKYYLTWKFEKEVGISINNYIKYSKIERAQQLLRTSTQTIQDICNTLNFSSRSYFSEIFKRIMGMSPGKFRELYRD